MCSIVIIILDGSQALAPFFYKGMNYVCLNKQTKQEMFCFFMRVVITWYAKMRTKIEKFINAFSFLYSFLSKLANGVALSVIQKQQQLKSRLIAKGTVPLLSLSSAKP